MTDHDKAARDFIEGLLHMDGLMATAAELGSDVVAALHKILDLAGKHGASSRSAGGRVALLIVAYSEGLAVAASHMEQLGQPGVAWKLRDLQQNVMAVFMRAYLKLDQGLSDETIAAFASDIAAIPMQSMHAAVCIGAEDMLKQLRMV